MILLTGSKFSRHRAQRAFSLLELLVVITLIAALLAISLPRFRGSLRNLQFDNFCQNLVVRMRYMRERAQINQQVFVLSVNQEDRRIEVEPAIAGLMGRRIVIPSSISVDTQDEPIVFLPDGSVNGPDMMVSDGVSSATIVIHAAVGRIEYIKDNEE